MTKTDLFKKAKKLLPNIKMIYKPIGVNMVYIKIKLGKIQLYEAIGNVKQVEDGASAFLSGMISGSRITNAMIQKTYKKIYLN